MTRNLFVKLIPLSLSVLVGLPAYANPSISSVSGNYDHGQEIVISGSGFGAKSNAAPVLWDTVDNIPSYSSLGDGATMPMGGSNPWPSPYGNSSGRNTVKIERSAAEQRGVSSAAYKAVNQKSAYVNGLTWPATSQLYVSWWWKQDQDTYGGDHSSKWLRVSDSSDQTGKTFSFNQQQAYIYASGSYCANDWVKMNGNPGKWNFIEAYFDNARQEFSIWINGQPFYDRVSWSPCVSMQMNQIWRIGFDGGGNNPPAITWWLDDIYVDSSFARVMLGNASTFSGSTVFEMQKPSQWNSSSVSVQFNQGSFSAGQTAYLYVVDGSGNVNAQGYPVTISGEGGGEPIVEQPEELSPPSPPSNVQIKKI